MLLLGRLGSHRAIAVVLTAMTALYMGLVVFNNITDFPTNRAFVEHVLAMDTTFKTPDTMWRAITDPTLALIAYIAIIVWEALTAVALAAGFVGWLRRKPAARPLAVTGLLMMVVLFGIGFIVIGGEWFMMWQSQQWNGLHAAINNFVVATAGLILVSLYRDER